jgi:predicted cobalt transporter CbtA
MERRLVLSGLLAGLLAGVVAFAYARLLGEPLIDGAIDYESGRAAAEAALAQAADSHHADGEVVSRGVQAGWGLAFGLIGYAVALGAVFSVVYAACLGRVGRLSPQILALLLAGAGLVSLHLVPFLKYPPNPPGASLEESARPRGGYYLLLVIASVALLVLAVWVGRRVARRFDTVNGTLAGAGAWALGVFLALIAFPSPGSMTGLGRDAETPAPLRDSDGTIVFPGFPADLLYDFRLYSIGVHLIVWAVLGIAFGFLLRRVRDGREAPRNLEDVFSS